MLNHLNGEFPNQGNVAWDLSITSGVRTHSDPRTVRHKKTKKVSALIDHHLGEEAMHHGQVLDLLPRRDFRGLCWEVKNGMCA